MVPAVANRVLLGFRLEARQGRPALLDVPQHLTLEGFRAGPGQVGVQVLILGSHDICAHRGWRLHAIGTDPEHVHIVLSWKPRYPWREVMDKLKNLLSLFIGRAREQLVRVHTVLPSKRCERPG